MRLRGGFRARPGERRAFAHAFGSVSVTQADEPLLLATTEQGQVLVYDVATTRLVRTIEEAGQPSLLQLFEP